MDPAVVLFLRTSLLWLVAGVTLGLGMAVSPALVVYRAAHIHMLLLGFVTGMIFGVGRPPRPAAESFRAERDHEIACHHSSGGI
jgi:hypothetical protein